MDLEEAFNITAMRSELDKLRFDFTLSVIIISIVIFLCLVLCAILYGWMYTMEKKLKKPQQQHTEEFKIRRVQITNRDDISRSSSQPQPLSVNQNPLARSNNYMAVVDDLKRNSNAPNSQQPRYPNYIEDNNNFSY